MACSHPKVISFHMIKLFYDWNQTWYKRKKVFILFHISIILAWQIYKQCNQISQFRCWPCNLEKIPAHLACNSWRHFRQDCFIPDLFTRPSHSSTQSSSSSNRHRSSVCGCSSINQSQSLSLLSNTQMKSLKASSVLIGCSWSPELHEPMKGKIAAEANSAGGKMAASSNL